MTYQKVKMTDKNTGFETYEEIKAETKEEALEIAQEEFSECENFKVDEE